MPGLRGGLAVGLGLMRTRPPADQHPELRGGDHLAVLVDDRHLAAYDA